VGLSRLVLGGHGLPTCWLASTHDSPHDRAKPAATACAPGLATCCAAGSRRHPSDRGNLKQAIGQVDIRCHRSTGRWPGRRAAGARAQAPARRDPPPTLGSCACVDRAGRRRGHWTHYRVSHVFKAAAGAPSYQGLNLRDPPSDPDLDADPGLDSPFRCWPTRATAASTGSWESSDINASFRLLFGPLSQNIRRGMSTLGQLFALEMVPCVHGALLASEWIRPRRAACPTWPNWPTPDAAPRCSPTCRPRPAACAVRVRGRGRPHRGHTVRGTGVGRRPVGR
jgi:hypothetical protein